MTRSSRFPRSAFIRGIMDDQLNAMLNCDTAERAKRGLAARSIDAALTQTAQELAANMASGQWPFSHGAGGGMSARAARNGWSGVELAENIAMGNSTADETFEQWMNSAGHRRNILDASTDLCGFGHAVSSRGEHYWAACYGSKSSGGHGGGSGGGGRGWWRWIRGWLGV